MTRLLRPTILSAPTCSLAIAFVCIALTSQLAIAVPITYLYEGTGTGTLGNSAFTNSNFRITANADTANITTWPPANNGPQNTHLATTIEIANLAGTFTINNASHSWMEGTNGGAGGLGQNLSSNWITLLEPALVGYDLATNIGPILETQPFDVGQFSGVFTSGGFLTFSSISSVTFTARLVPEPCSMVLFIVGSLACAARRRNRRAR